MKVRSLNVLFALAAIGCLTGSVCGNEVVSGTSGEWRQFRGPQGNGVSQMPHPEKWSNEENVAWSAEIPGGGWSSPVVSGDLVFVTTAVSTSDEKPKGFGEGVTSMRSFYQSKAPDEPFSFEVHCLDLTTGDLKWKKSIVSRKPPFKIHPSNSYATESPVTDGTNVYAYFGAIGVVGCLDRDGEVIWTRDLGAYPTSNDFGTGSSLALDGDKVFVQCDNEKNSFVCALDSKSGEDVWKVEREGRTSWSSPLLWANRGGTELVVCGAGNVTSYNPDTGEIIWRLSGTGGAFSASPTCDTDRIYFGNSGRNSRGPLVALNAGARGELTLDSIGDDGIAWIEDSSAPGMCSPVVIDGRVFVLSRGILSCHDAETGERIYRERLKDASSVTASLWASGGMLFALNESGTTAVVKVGDEFQLAGSNETDGLYWATPSVAGDRLLLRSAEGLRCISK